MTYQCVADRQVTCPACDTPFLSTWTGGRRRTYCGRRCQRSVNKLGGATIRRSRRHRIYARDQHTCHLCRRAVRHDVPIGHPWSATLDHLVPRAAGGKHTTSNLATAHLWCNMKRRDRPMSEHFAWAAAGPPLDGEGGSDV